MQLTLVRHGEAAPPVKGNDTRRPLTARGHAQAEQTAEFLKNMVTPDVFVVSPLLRAQETLHHIQKYFPETNILICDKIKPEDYASDAIDWLSQLPFESIVVVCHMNVVGYIDQLLTGQSFSPFALAEARVYSQTVIANGLSTQKDRFVPTV